MHCLRACYLFFHWTDGSVESMTPGEAKDLAPNSLQMLTLSTGEPLAGSHSWGRYQLESRRKSVGRWWHWQRRWDGKGPRKNGPSCSCRMVLRESTGLTHGKVQLAFHSTPGLLLQSLKDCMKAWIWAEWGQKKLFTKWRKVLSKSIEQTRNKFLPKPAGLLMIWLTTLKEFANTNFVRGYLPLSSSTSDLRAMLKLDTRVLSDCTHCPFIVEFSVMRYGMHPRGPTFDRMNFRAPRFTRVCTHTHTQRW